MPLNSTLYKSRIKLRACCLKDKYSPGEWRLYQKPKVDVTTLINSSKPLSQRVAHKGRVMNVVLYLLASSEVLLWDNSPTAIRNE